MKKIPLADILLYILLLILVFLAVLLVGLLFFHQETLHILDTIKVIAIIAGSVATLFIIVKNALHLLQHIITGIEQYNLSVAERKEIESKAKVLDAEAEKIKAEASIITLRGHAEVEQIRARTTIELQAAQYLKFGINESVYQITPENELLQVVEASRGQEVKSFVAPTAPIFRDMKHLVTDKNNIPLAYSQDGPIYGQVNKHLLSKLIVGMPGRGKSVALLYDLALLVCVGALPVIFDPQGSLKELKGLLPYFDTYNSFYDAMPVIENELTERDELWRSSNEVKEPLVFLADEVVDIAAYETKEKVHDGIMDLARNIVLLHRKHEVFTILAGQSIPVSVIPSVTRDNMSARQLFAMKNRQADVAGLDTLSRKTLMPFIEKAGTGVSILDLSMESQPIIVSTPFTEAKDVAELVAGNDRYHVWLDKFM